MRCASGSPPTLGHVGALRSLERTAAIRSTAGAPVVRLRGCGRPARRTPCRSCGGGARPGPRRETSDPSSCRSIRHSISSRPKASSGSTPDAQSVTKRAKSSLEAAEAGRRCDEYVYIPAQLKEPYLSRRRQLGYELYRLYGIERTDFAARKEAALRNFRFFGAPVGLFFTMEKYLLHGSWLDCGMFMQNVMTLARAYGLETCPQQAWCEYGGIIHQQLNISGDDIILSGMALGYA